MLKLKTVVITAALLGSGGAHAQTWNPMGPAPVYELTGTPSPSTDAQAYTNVSGVIQGPYQNAAQGAMSGLLPGATSGTYYASAVNGGVWKSTNSGDTWTAIGDNLPSLSIASMVYDASNQQKIWVGFGHKSALNDIGGYLAGVAVYDTSTGTWSAPVGNATMKEKNITQLAVNGDNIYIGSKGTTAANQGVWISTNGGSAFAQVNTTTSGFKPGDVTSVVQYTSGGVSTIYAGLIGTAPADTGVYVSTNNGAAWNKISGIGNYSISENNTSRIMLAIGADGTAVASLLTKNINDNSQVNVFQIKNSGATFTTTSFGQPVADVNGKNLYLYNGGQIYFHAALAIDPTNSNRIYIGGDRQPETGDKSPIGANVWNGNLFCGTYNPTTGITTWEPITNSYALNNSGPHADARYLYIDASGNLLEGDDGGIYYRTNPTTSNGQWYSLNGNLQTGEMHTARWNSLTHTVLGAMQDNGTYFQISPKSPAGYAVNGGDGGIAEVNPRWTDNGKTYAALYSSYIYLQSLYRTQVDSSGLYQTSTEVTLIDNAGNFLNTTEKIAEKYFPFTPSFALNAQDKTRFAAGGYSVYVGQDTLGFGESNKLTLTVRSVNPSPLSTDYYYRTIAYGASNNTNALVTGTARTDLKVLDVNATSYDLCYTPDVATKDVQSIYSNATYGIQAAIFDKQYGTNDIYFTDSQVVRRIQNPVYEQTSTPTDISVNLRATYPSFKEIRGLTHVYNNGVSALVAAGVTRPADATSVTVDNKLYSLSAPATATASAVWNTNLGMLPNAQVFGLDYSVEDDVLLANLMGRGAYSLYDVTTFYREANKLVFGKAQNDSTPTLDQLKDGVGLNSVTFIRKLIKEGTGILDLTDKASEYGGGTELNGGGAKANADGNFGVLGTDISFNGGTLKYTQAFALNRPLTIASGGGTLDLGGNLSVISQGTGAISGAGQLTIAGVGTYNLTQSNAGLSGGLAIGSALDSAFTTVVASANDNLGAAGSKISFDKGTLKLDTAFAATLTTNQFDRPFDVGSASGMIDTSALGGTALSYTGGVVASSASGNTAGVLYFTGTPFTMGANLKLNAFWGADLTAPAGMTLSGLAGVGPGSHLTVNGIYAPGNSPGTAVSYGSIAMNPGSKLDIEIDGTGIGDGAGNYDRIILLESTGTFTAGGSLDPVLRGISSGNNTFTPALGQGFRIVAAPGGVSGSFAALIQPTDGLATGTRLDTVYGSTYLDLYATPASYSNIAAAGVANNSNRQQVGSILEGIRPDAGIRESSATRKFLFDSLAPQTTSSLPVALDQLSGVGYGQLIGMNFENSKFLVNQIGSTVAQQRHGEAQHPGSGQTPDQITSGPPEEMWGSALGRISNWSGDGVGYDTSDVLSGAMGGIQRRFTPQSLAGFALAFANSNPNISQNMGSGPMQNLQLMGYVSHAMETGFYVQGLLGGGGGSINASRNINMMNTSYNAVIHTANIAGSVLAGWAVESAEKIRYATGLGGNYQGMYNFGFTDSGSQSAYALSTQAGNTQSFMPNMSASASIPFRAQQIDWTGYGLVNVGYETADNKITMLSNFMGSPISVESSSIGRTHLNLGVGISGSLGKETKVALDVAYQSAQNWNAAVAYLSLRVGF